MSPLMEAAAPSAEHAIAAQDLFRQNRFAARKAQVQLPEYSFPVAQNAQDLANGAEDGLSDWGRFQSGQQQARIQAGIGVPLNTPSFNTNYDLSEEDEQDLEDFEDNTAENQIASRLDEYSHAKAQSRQKSLLSDLASKQITSSAENLAKEIYASIPGLVADCDTPLEDGGATLGGGTTTAFYQLIVTYFDKYGERIESSPLGKMLPPRFNKRTIIGWGMIVNAVFLCLWSGVAFMIAMTPVFLIIIVAGGAIGGILFMLASFFS